MPRGVAVADIRESVKWLQRGLGPGFTVVSKTRRGRERSLARTSGLPVARLAPDRDAPPDSGDGDPPPPAPAPAPPSGEAAEDATACVTAVDPPPTGTAWMSVASAASYLGLTPSAFRRTLERRAIRIPDGGIEAQIDGVRARRFGRLWRVSFSARWLIGAPAALMRARGHSNATLPLSQKHAVWPGGNRS